MLDGGDAFTAGIMDEKSVNSDMNDDSQLLRTVNLQNGES
jgi:hypothetical protein